MATELLQRGNSKRVCATNWRTVMDRHHGGLLCPAGFVTHQGSGFSVLLKSLDSFTFDIGRLHASHSSDVDLKSVQSWPIVTVVDVFISMDDSSQS